MTDKIQRMEDRHVPKGRIDLIGCGRLGLRIAINLMQVHRGGPKIIGAFDGQKIDGGDVIFTLYGAEIGQNKTDFRSMQSREIPKYMISRRYISAIIAFIVAFSALFMEIYKPFSLAVWFSTNDTLHFSLTILFYVAAIVVLIASRSTMYALQGRLMMIINRYVTTIYHHHPLAISRGGHYLRGPRHTSAILRDDDTCNTYWIDTLLCCLSC